MKLSSRGGLLTLFAALFTGFLAGSARLEKSSQPVTLEQVQVIGIHPAALYVRTSTGAERRFLIDPLDQDWAHSLAESARRRWHLELEPTSCLNRYTLRTAVGSER